MDGEEERDFYSSKGFREHSKQLRCQERGEELFREVCLETHGWRKFV